MLGQRIVCAGGLIQWLEWYGNSPVKEFRSFVHRGIKLMHTGKLRQLPSYEYDCGGQTDALFHVMPVRAAPTCQGLGCTAI
jgi:hypothetical protein